MTNARTLLSISLLAFSVFGGACGRVSVDATSSDPRANRTLQTGTKAGKTLYNGWTIYDAWDDAVEKIGPHDELKIGQLATVSVIALVGDLVLPLPNTAVMSGLGYVYGTLAGGAIAAAGSFLSGALAYGLCRRFGERMATRFMGAEGFASGQRLFRGGRGGFIVALSRCLPMLPEIIACMAGLTKMPPGRFFSALACGCVPMGFLYAWIGDAGRNAPGLAIGLSIVIPAILYGTALLIMRKNR